MFDSGKLRHQITWQQYQTGQVDALGQESQSWQTVSTQFAFVETLTGNENVNDDEIRATTNYRVLMRYLPGLGTRDRFQFGNLTLNITTIVDVENRQRWLQVYCSTANTGQQR